MRPCLVPFVALNFFAAALLAATPASALTIDMPPDRVTFGPGPGHDTAQGYCGICHSPQYIYTQPPLTRDQWRGEVDKMRKVYGAPIPEDAVPAIVDYLVSQNSQPGAGGEQKVERPR